MYGSFCYREFLFPTNGKYLCDDITSVTIVEAKYRFYSLQTGSTSVTRAVEYYTPGT